ncbi:hypothetical protein MBLNU459_g1308t1 [Dothideomycetes sp. NU459]
MPAYEVEHIFPLTERQKDELAEAITKIHSSHFSTPKIFVNVRFTNVEGHSTYVAGKRNEIQLQSPKTNGWGSVRPPQRKANRIFAYVRHGPSRTQSDYDAVSVALTNAWDEIVPLPQVKRSLPAPDTELRLVMFYGAIVAGTEAGFSIPPAGGDKQWLKDNLEAFKQKADGGDEDFQDMVKEITERGLV